MIEKWATCDFCNQEMAPGNGCTTATVKFPDGKMVLSTPFQGDNDNEICHDCNTRSGQYHHPGCDQERCSHCQGQLISCGCLDEDGDDFYR